MYFSKKNGEAREKHTVKSAGKANHVTDGKRGNKKIQAVKSAGKVKRREKRTMGKRMAGKIRVSQIT